VAVSSLVTSSSGGSARAEARVHPSRRTETLAALDLGTNNCRLLIAKPSSAGYRVIDGYSRIVRLGAGVEESGVLSEAAMTRAVEALKICGQKISRRGVTRMRAVATEACRRARNCDEFSALVHAETGIALEIISSREEAELTLSGCRSLLDPDKRYALLFDVGGGSTELIWLKLNGHAAPTIIGWASYPCGVVTLTERHGSYDYRPEEYAPVVAEVRELLERFEAQHEIRHEINAGSVQLIGTAGTVTTVAGVHLALERYDRRRVDGASLDLKAVREVTEWLARSSYDDRAQHRCIGRDRADLVVAGCAVLDAVLGVWPCETLRVADRGVREGILAGFVAELGQGGEIAGP